MAHRNDPVRDAYKAQHEANMERLKNSKMPRDRFIASEIGYCKRRIWYRHQGWLPAVFSARGSDYSRDGDAHHDLVRTFLADVGGASIEGVERDKMGNLSIETIKKDVKVKHKDMTLAFHVRVDGIIKLGRSKAVLEIKSIGNRQYYEYNNLWSSTLEHDEIYRHMLENNASYIYQCHVGMYALKLKKAYVVLKGRDNSCTGLHSQRDPDQILGGVTVPWSNAIWQTVLNRAALVQHHQKIDTPPRQEFLRSSKECGYCPFFHLCHGADKRRKQRIKPHAEHPQLGEILHVKDLK